jgi:RND family efflux transporter MFP subunit
MRTLVQILIIVAVLAGAGAIARWQIERRPVLEPQAVLVSAPLVEVLVVKAAPFQRTVHGRGEVSPREQTPLVSEVAGRVSALSPALVSGGAFSAGDVLVELDSADLEVAQTRADAALVGARTALTREQAEAAVAARQYAQLGQGQASPLALREPQLAEATARVAAAEADLERATRDLERARIAAPFDGRVRSENVGLGQLVARGEVLGELFSTDLAEVRVSVPDGQLAHLTLSGFGVLQDGPAAVLSTEFGGVRRRWPGRVLRVTGEVDRTSRMVTLVVGVPEPYGQAARLAGSPLMPGLFVDVAISGIRDSAGILIPRSAVHAGPRVFVIDDGDRLRFRNVVVAWRDTDRVLVLSGMEGGLLDGERVCISPLAAPVDGMRVQVKGEDPDSAPQDGRTAEGSE